MSERIDSIESVDSFDSIEIHLLRPAGNGGIPGVRLAGHAALRREGDGSPYPPVRCTVSLIWHNGGTLCPQKKDAPARGKPSPAHLAVRGRM